MIAALASRLDCSLFKTVFRALKIFVFNIVELSTVEEFEIEVFIIDELLSTSSRKDDWHWGQLYEFGIPPLSMAKTLPHAVT